LNYIVALDNLERIKLKETKEELQEKISKISHKNAMKKEVQITTNDGRTFNNNEGKIGDSIIIKLPEGKMEKLLKLEENATVYITNGSHCSEKGKIKEIIPSTIKREKMIKIDQDGTIFETLAKNIIVIGKEKEEIRL
jgi:small subunit ribosomal protein S4e